jgi:glycerol uptake facilitator-like aquaporin
MQGLACGRPSRPLGLKGQGSSGRGQQRCATLSFTTPIGLTLTAIHIVGINVTGVSVNPARSIGPALIGIFHNPEAFVQLWVFIIAPMIGAGAAGQLFKPGAVLSIDQP